MPQLYTVPPGYYDLPFSWIYEGADLTDGSNVLNQVVPILGGYGDFVLRRIVGADTIVNPSGGKIQVRDRSLNYIQSDPLFAQCAPDIAIAPELFYPENGGIRFDLYKVLRETGFVIPGAPAIYSQLCFQGARRLKGVYPFKQTYDRYNPKTFAYVTSFTLTNPFLPPDGLNGTITPIFQKVTDYDFELLELRLVYTTAASVTVSDGLLVPDGTVWGFNTPGTSGNGSTLTITGGPALNQVLTFTVTGTNIAVQLATDGGGLVTTDIATLVAAANANPAVHALVTVSGFGAVNGTLAPTTGGLPVAFAGGGVVPTNASSAKLFIYDAHNHPISNVLGLDQFFNRIQFGGFQNGAFVPTLLYPKDHQIRVDVQSLTYGVPLGLTFNWIGKQRIPC